MSAAAAVRTGVSRTRAQFAAHPLLFGLLALSVIYFWRYLSSQALPGNTPEGWLGWYDQYKTMESARALSAFDFDPERHWYVPGYALLGAPFIGQGFRAHPFVFVDLACLLATCALFVRFARACAVGPAVAVVLFLVSALWAKAVFDEWVIPWNSSPAAVLVWAILALCAAWLAGRKRPLLMGAAVGLLPFFRPTELLPVAAALAGLGWAEWRRGRLRWRDALGLAIGFLVAVAPQVALHLAIYGMRPSGYMQLSGQLGFTLHDFAWKAYVILADPYPWFTDGEGMLHRLPWMALALAGLVPALVGGGAARLLAGAVLVHLVLYLSYMDLLPTGLWRFNNVHYWKWALPGDALLAWLLLRDLVARPRTRQFGAALAGLAVVALLALVRIEPGPAAEGELAKLLLFRGDPPTFVHANFGAIAAADAGGQLRNIVDFRVIPVADGVRLIAMRRDFRGEVRFASGGGLAPNLEGAVPLRFAERVGLGVPCWLHRCGKRPRNALLPPPG